MDGIGTPLLQSAIFGMLVAVTLFGMTDSGTWTAVDAACTAANGCIFGSVAYLIVLANELPEDFE